MSQRKTWLEEEDRVLKMLVVERGLTKWAKIAKIMAEQFQLTDRTGKQCRERYHNHLDNRIKHGPWSKQEEEALIGLQNNMGNHWAEISRVLAGRSENCVKNKFYSILRRGVKVLNLAIKNHFKKYKELEVSNTYKIVDCCEPAFGAQAPSLKCSESCDIKKRLIFYGMRDDSYPFTKEDYADIKSLIDSIRLFRKRQKSTIGPEATRLEEKGEGAESKSPEAEMKTEEGKQAPYPDLDFDFLDHPQEQI